MEEPLTLKDFILDKYTEAKVPEKTLDVVFENKIEILSNENGQEKCKGLMFPFARSPLQKVAIKHSTILLKPGDHVHNKEIVEITLNVKDFIEFVWQPGDTISILPSNSNKDTTELLQLLDLEEKADTICFVKVPDTCTKKTAKVPVYIPSKTTPREIIRDCLNIKSILKKQFLRSLAEYCSDNDEKQFLKSISSKEGSSFYNILIIDKGLTLVDLLKYCPTCRPPFCLIIEHLLRLLPRPYSIANSPLRSTKEMSFIFSILCKKSGVTTNMLKEKITNESSSLLIYLRESNYFRYTEEDYTKNQILIAIGTGLAPFLGFLQHKEHMMNEVSNSRPGITWLFVGATSAEAVIHREQLLEWQSKNILNKFEESYSRVDTTAQRHYVQDSLECNSQEIIKLLVKPETVIYLCADGAHISKSIEKSLQHILEKELTITKDESIEMLKDFKAQRKYREDIWL